MAQMATRLTAAFMVLVVSECLGYRAIYRLPSTVVPTRYKINMDTHFQDDNFTFYGEEWIDFTVQESISNLTLHSKGLHIVEDDMALFSLPQGMNASEDDMMTKEMFNSSSMMLTTDKSHDLVHFALESPLNPGENYRLHLSFTGQLSKSLTGYYRESYLDQQANITRWLSSTTFEPTDARRAFPCFDEPGFKSIFQINLARRDDQTALSNMPLENTTPMEGREGWVWDHFQESPPMPTFLVAFYTGHLQSGEDNGTAPFRIWSRPDVLQHTRLAVNIGTDLLRVLTTLTGVDNPLPKQDVLALPAFISDGLENWGLISFGEKYLLHQPGITPISHVEKSAFILAHELAHNWFGNLVGVKWWSDIWLSEGFATYYGALAVDQVRPEWDSQIFVGKVLMRVLSLDSARTSHPLTFHVTKSEELRMIFNRITYMKGFYILRMLSNSLGQDTFLRGTTRYLKSHRFSTAGQEDLWQHLTSQAHEDGVLPTNTSLQQIMDPWSKNEGYPIISVLRDYDNGTATISQRRFLKEEGDVVEGRARASGGGKLRPSSMYGWWVPITFTTQSRLQFNNTTPSSWLRPSDSYLTLHQLPEDQWVLLNLQAAGLYRVQYDDRNWRLLGKYLDSDNYRNIHVLNRVQLIDDALNLAKLDQLSYPVALDVLTYILREEHMLPWKAAFDNLAYMYKMIDNTDVGPAFKSFVLRLVSSQYVRLGFRGDIDDVPQLQTHRKQVRRWACAMGHSQCVKSALDLLDKWLAEPSPDSNNPISNDVRGLVYCTGAEQGGQERWGFMWERYRHSKHRGDRSSLLTGLACSRDPATLQRLLDWSVQKSSGMRKEESAAVFKAVARTEVGNNVGRLFLQQRMDDIVHFVGPNPFHVPLLIDAVSSRLKQPEHLRELEELTKKQNVKPQSARTSMQQAMDKARFNTQWLQKNLKPISNWLEAHSQLTTLPAR